MFSSDIARNIWHKSLITYLTLRLAGNVAYGKNATQGPLTSLDRVAWRALDGNHDPDSREGSCAHTTGPSGQTGWWEVDLMGDYVVLAVNLTNRIDCGNVCRGEFSHAHTHTHIVNAVILPGWT